MKIQNKFIKCKLKNIKKYNNVVLKLNNKKDNQHTSNYTKYIE